MNKLNIAIAAEFELCEKIADFLQNSGLEISQLSIVEIYPFNEEQGVRFNNKAVPQVAMDSVNWADFDYVLFAGEPTLAPHIANAVEVGCKVIDVLGVCAEISGVPVIVPSVNDEQINEILPHNIIALPNPQVTQTALALATLVQQIPLNQVMITSLLPASYQNAETVGKLAGQTARLLNGIPLDDNEQRLAFDVFPQTSHFSNQLAKIFPGLNTIFHAIQVPVFYGMAQKITALSDYEIDTERLEQQWQQNDFIQFEENLMTPVLNGEKESTEEAVKLHINSLTAVENGVEFWTVADEQRFNLAFLAVRLLAKIHQNL